MPLVQNQAFTSTKSKNPALPMGEVEGITEPIETPMSEIEKLKAEIAALEEQQELKALMKRRAELMVKDVQVDAEMAALHEQHLDGQDVLIPLKASNEQRSNRLGERQKSLAARSQRALGTTIETEARSI